MQKAVGIYGRKILSVTLIFNALLTILCAVGLLHGVYLDHWKPYVPYLVDGNLLWLMIAAAVLNIFPCATLGKVHTGRLWFHHYVYGFVVLLSAFAWIILFTPVSLVNAFMINTTNATVNAGRFFALGGLALVLDDLPDVSKYMEHSLGWLKRKAAQVGKLLHAVQFLLGVMVMYLVFAISLAIIQSPQGATTANVILIGTLMATAATSFAAVKRKTWLNLKPGHCEKPD
jgi:hypothetical protein